MLPKVSNRNANPVFQAIHSRLKMKNIFSLLLKKTGLFTAILLTVGLTGCSTLQSINPTRLFSSETPRQCVDTVSIKGRFSIQYKLDDGEESLHGKFGWEQSPDSTVVTLMSPLGQTMAKIEVTPRMATFIAPNRSPQSAANAEELIKSQLGWTLPVSGLKGWLQGCATDSQGHSFIATPELTQVITKDGWQINKATCIDGPTMPLPKRIDLVKESKESKNGVDINLKLVIDEWHF